MDNYLTILYHIYGRDFSAHQSFDSQSQRTIAILLVQQTITRAVVLGGGVVLGSALLQSECEIQAILEIESYSLSSRPEQCMMTGSWMWLCEKVTVVGIDRTDLRRALL